MNIQGQVIFTNKLIFVRPDEVDGMIKAALAAGEDPPFRAHQHDEQVNIHKL